MDYEPTGFEWVDCTDPRRSVVSFLRRGRSSADKLLFACNFMLGPRHNYRVGARGGSYWHEVLNSDAPLSGRRWERKHGWTDGGAATHPWQAVFLEYDASSARRGDLQT